MAKVKLTLSVQDSHLNSLDQIAKAAEKAGMRVEQKLTDIGVLTGTIEAGNLDSLKKIDGISHVEEERTFQLPDPDNPVQ